METLVCAKILDYLDANNLLSHSQWGFRPGRSTLSQLLLAQSDLVEYFNEVQECADQTAILEHSSSSMHMHTHKLCNINYIT